MRIQVSKLITKFPLQLAAMKIRRPRAISILLLFGDPEIEAADNENPSKKKKRVGCDRTG